MVESKTAATPRPAASRRSALSLAAFALLLLLLQSVTLNLVVVNAFAVPSTQTKPKTRSLLAPTATGAETEVDVIVVGAGLGGLSCAALSAKYGLRTICLEAHDTAGGCAHSFSRYSSASKDVPFRFDSGPSLVSGLSQKSMNPLRQVLDAIGTADDIEWCTYNGWMIHDLADGKAFRVTTGDAGEFERAIQDKAGPASRRAFEDFKAKMLESRGLSQASAYIPPFALRGGVRAVASLAPYFAKLLSIGAKGTLLTGPFSKVMDLYELKDPFVFKWFDYLSFALSGEDAAHTQAAPIAYMMTDLHAKDKVLDYPMGGMDSLIQALVNGIRKHGGELQLNSRVENFLLNDVNGRANCVGVQLDDGRIIKAKKGVVSNAPLWNMAKILQDSVRDADMESSSVRDAVDEVQKQADSMFMTGSFMHLHLGIPKDGLPEDLDCHHSVLNLDVDVRAEQNMVIISIPTVFDPSLAPEGYHIVHAYTAASDSFDDWLPFLEDEKESGKVGANPNSGTAAKYSRDKAYQTLKDQKSEALWKAIERVIPDVRKRATEKGAITLIGTPLTHRRYNQRFRGTYGPGPAPGKDVWELNGATTPISNLLACGDTTFPGIGLPGVAASGTIAANTLVSIGTQMKLMRELRDQGALQ
jgi:phytoene dehydrogenase-like protein